MTFTQTYVQPAVDLSKIESAKKLPYSEEMEAAVLGAVLIDKNALPKIEELTKVKTFYSEAHKIIYAAMVEMFKASEAIDLMTLSSHLRKSNSIRQAGGTKYLAHLMSRVNSASNIEYHALIISQLNIKREMIERSKELMKAAFDESNDIFEVLNNTEQEFFKISEQSISKNYMDAGEIMRLTIEELENKKINNTSGITGIPSGFTGLDDLTGGWQSSELTIIAARPGMGKTAFVVSAMRNAAVDDNSPVAIFSLEMSATQLMTRMISSEVEIEGKKLRKGNLEPHEWQQLHTRLDKLSNAPIFIDDTPALSILDLRAKCRRLKAQYGIKMVIIDYLQLMTGDDGTGVAGNREQEIAMISRSLKNLSKELEVPVIALSQLSRAVETRGGDKRPQLSDLRESGSIEQDADMVMFLYRPDYYGISEDEAGNDITDLGELIIAKNRAGTLKTVNLKFIGHFTKFTDWNAGMGNSALDYGKITLPGEPGDFSHFESQASAPAENATTDFNTFLSKASDASKPESDDPLNSISPNDEVPF